MELKEIRQELKDFFESGIKPDNLNDKFKYAIKNGGILCCIQKNNKEVNKNTGKNSEKKH